MPPVLWEGVPVLHVLVSMQRVYNAFAVLVVASVSAKTWQRVKRSTSSISWHSSLAQADGCGIIAVFQYLDVLRCCS